MPHRILLLLGMVALAGCRNGNEGAVKLTVSYTGFKPGCIRVGVRDAAGAGEPRLTELPGKGERTGGTVTVAAFREAGWGSSLVLKAEAFEGECQGTPVTSITESVVVTRGQVAEKEMKLAATDADADGYVSRATGGSDCDDTRAEVHPTAQERCNGRDDNCDEVQDDGFEVGSLCDAPDGCMGAWVCDTSGARTCEARPGQWRRDADGDGRGSREGGGLTACQQPAGYVPNSDDCDDTDPKRYLGAPELCNYKDDNCDTLTDEGMDLGLACTGTSGCSGTRACALDGGVMCDSPTPTALWPDQDQDQRGAPDAGVMSCSSTLPGHVSNDEDCDDTRAHVYLGAPEVCDGLDNDCDLQTDESFNVDAACDPGKDCNGAVACAADGGTECRFIEQPSTWYPDEDRDLRGKEDAGVSTCKPGSGYIPDAGDCNDGNLFSYAGAPELCDGEDNDCNGSADDTSVCEGATPQWVSRRIGTDTGKVWYSVDVWGDGGVWLVGDSSRRARQRPGESSFTYFDSNCSGDWLSVWVDDSTGKAYLGGLSGKLGIQGVNSNTCSVDPPSADDSETWGLWGFTTDGGVDIHGVGINGSNGRAFLWNGGAAAQTVTRFSSVPFYGVHGLSPDTLFAVGGPVSTALIHRYSTTNTGWESVQAPSNQGGLNAVHVVHPGLAFAVGENRTVLKWDGQAWAPHPVTLDTNVASSSGEDLNGVLAFGDSSLYVVSRSGNIFHFNGQQWRKLFSVSGERFYDIAGTRPDDIWVVGTSAHVIHWPK